MMCTHLVVALREVDVPKPPHHPRHELLLPETLRGLGRPGLEARGGRGVQHLAHGAPEEVLGLLHPVGLLLRLHLLNKIATKVSKFKSSFGTQLARSLLNYSTQDDTWVVALVCVNCQKFQFSSPKYTWIRSKLNNWATYQQKKRIFSQQAFVFPVLHRGVERMYIAKVIWFH